MRGESPEALKALLNQHLESLGPTDGVELGMVQEMVAAYWRLCRAWANETRTFDNHLAAQTNGDRLDRLTGAFADLAAKPPATLLHRYETRLHLIYHRALQSLLLLRLARPNEPRKLLKTIDRTLEPAPVSEEPSGAA
jgi:hypothetical protein